MADNAKTTGAGDATVSVKLLRPVYTRPGARPLPIGTVMDVDAITAAFWASRGIAVRASAELAKVEIVTGHSAAAASAVTPAPMPPAPPLKEPAPAPAPPPH
ncbi:hypothetical protein HLH33_12935 [Gluconacetobacter diazotrophicus]|uniref:Uncharacterized protein n=1 Tax=Gluconacetobacter diazotrophicus TaxID=33996 RepID=A0A7W4I6M4_GLUDI|nr:hypothetical protein [Gluconacetobacter diazotrophicus]MBB2157204.1 hypothetical protein [Gluconacetobacter diazotrophicus]